jgi:citrate lyase beta subunit
MQKTASLPVDTVILDLEDSVSPDQKETARAAVCKLVAQRPFGKREVVVRINGTDTPWWKDDLEAVASVVPNAILLPKVSTPDSVRSVDRFLETHATAAVFTKIWAMMETALGVLNASQIAFSTSRLECLVLGTEDLVKEMRAAHTSNREPVLFALSTCVLAARAAGLSVLDGVYVNFGDETGFVAQVCLCVCLHCSHWVVDFCDVGNPGSTTGL